MRINTCILGNLVFNVVRVAISVLSDETLLNTIVGLSDCYINCKERKAECALRLKV